MKNQEKGTKTRLKKGHPMSCGWGGENSNPQRANTEPRSKPPSFHVSKAPGLQASRGPKLLQPPSFSSFQAPKQPQAFKPAADSSLQAFHKAKPPSFSSFSSLQAFSKAPCKTVAPIRTSTSFSKMYNFYLSCCLRVYRNYIGFMSAKVSRKVFAKTFLVGFLLWIQNSKCNCAIQSSVMNAASCLSQSINLNFKA